MSNERKIVVTAYGHGHIIDKFAISIFSPSDGPIYNRENENANTYCEMINSLELKDCSWVYAKIIPENTPVDLDTFFPFNFDEVILKLDNQAIQKFLREIDTQAIGAVLTGVCDDVKKKLFANMTSRAAKMLKEEMERMGQINSQAVGKQRDKALRIVRHLADTGEITIGENKEGTNDQ